MPLPIETELKLPDCREMFESYRPLPESYFWEYYPGLLDPKIIARFALKSPGKKIDASGLPVWVIEDAVSQLKLDTQEEWKVTEISLESDFGSQVFIQNGEESSIPHPVVLFNHSS